MRLIPKDDELGWTPYAWTVYVAFFAISPALARNAAPFDWLVSIGGTLALLALYFRGYWVRGARIIPIIAGITLIGLVIYPMNSTAGVCFIYAASFAARLDNDRAAIATIAGIEIAVGIEVFLSHYHPLSFAWVIVFVALVGAINIHFEGVGRSQAKLRLAHDEIEHLAKVAERERIARDLHDLLGHTLSVIILKSELASKLAERDPEKARDEIRDVERISRDALTQVRAAVRGYRSGGLQAEIESARDALDAANVTLDRDLAKLQLPPAHEAVIALAIREAVTNIVRHAHATQCRIALTPLDNTYALTITDNGRGGSVEFGSGLSGMRERIETLGGTLTLDGSNGTTVTITMPRPLMIAERTA
ncbi:MAG TPA: sensor histidine kinase [Thermoanaerobaculia bacterium]